MQIKKGYRFTPFFSKFFDAQKKPWIHTVFIALNKNIQLKLYFVALESLIALVAGFPDMQKDLKKVMAGEMEIVVNEEKSVLIFLLSSN